MITINSADDKNAQAKMPESQPTFQNREVATEKDASPSVKYSDNQSSELQRNLWDFNIAWYHGDGSVFWVGPNGDVR